ncbi:MAG: hypothetical protein ORN83_03875, partial [Chthoniobacteraceae bacterium]|nr:hypothetical protein [Chthoniobacteraceae bacterium]
MKDTPEVSSVEIYLKKQVTEPSIIQATSLAIDEWQARLPYSPIGKFSQDTIFVKLIDHACFSMEIETQVVNRTLKQNLTPDDGDSCPDEPDDLQEFDVWGQKYPLELDFQEHERSIQIPETRERITCDRCEGSGKTSCADCDGSALVTCGKGLFSIGCGGSGQVDITRERKVLREGGRVGMDGSEYRT